jgi:hypothetical protein
MLAVPASATWAQNSGAQSYGRVTPLQPISATSNDAVATDGSTASAMVEVDLGKVPITGAEQPTVKVPTTRSFLSPHLDFLGQLDTNGYNGTNSGNNTVSSINSILGGLTLQKVGAQSQFNLDYLGGRSLSNQGHDFNSTTQLFGLIEKWKRARWAGLFADRLSYMSESTFGGGAPFDIGSMNLAEVGLRNSFLPAQSIFTSRGPRLSNASVAEVDYQTSPRSSVTVLGSYGLLRFFNAGLTNSHSLGFQAGLNHRCSQRDTIGAIYALNAFRFSGANHSIKDHAFQLAYQHQIGPRLSFQVAGGPDVAFIQDRATGPENQVSWNLHAALESAIGRTTLFFSYDHYLTGGSGLLLGAQTDQVTGTMNREVSRFWTASVLGGYARNSRLAGGSTLTTSSNESFNSVFGSVQVNRILSRSLGFFVGYSLRHQNAYATVCTGPSCDTKFVGHQITFGLNWHPFPIRLY